MSDTYMLLLSEEEYGLLISALLDAIALCRRENLDAEKYRALLLQVRKAEAA